jgi:hypothetical protein
VSTLRNDGFPNYRPAVGGSERSDDVSKRAPSGTTTGDEIVRHGCRHSTWLAIVAVAVAAMGATSAQAAKAKRVPSIEFAVAVYEEANGSVKMAVKVEGASHVSISFEGARRDAVRTVASDQWWNADFNGTVRDCYRIVVHAANERGQVDRRLGAGRLGTAGCANCDEAEQARARAHHKVKRARALLRDADSQGERRHARHRLRRAKRRLDGAEQRLESCLAQREVASQARPGSR